MPQPSQQRISDADRQRVTERLQAAVGVGRLTLAEFEQRLSAVLAARTLGEVEPFVADLPGGAVSAPAPEYVALRTRAASLKRRGQWVVARRTLVVAKSGSVKLDFTDALIAHPEVTIELDVQSGSTTLVYTACSRPQSQDPVCTSLCVASNERDGWSSATRVAFGGGAGERVARSETTQYIWLNADLNGMQRFAARDLQTRSRGMV